jgi:hypothetical protein
MPGFPANMRIIILFLIFLSARSSQAQDNTLRFEEGMSSPRAVLEAVSWISGHWSGEALGGITEEIWTPPLGGSMMFAFKLVEGGIVRFYELGYIREVNNTLLLQLKHFDHELRGWEEKEETIDFPLVKIEGNRAYFDGMTFENINPDTMNVYLLTEDKNGLRETLFQYRRIDN